MKRLVILLSMVMLFITGCSITKLDDTDIGKNMKILLSQDNKLYNVHYSGYKYYLPKGISFVNKDDYNSVLSDSHGNKYYMFVDAISYYYKVENTYKVNSDSHYSKIINYNDKSGYIQIDEVKNKYFVQYVFNYVKIEAYVDKNELTSCINNMSYILRSVKFNRTIVESLVGENVSEYDEENFSLFKADVSTESFLDVVERTETDAYRKDLEDEKIELDY
ncbi:MAG: hypothetical protein IJ463_08115 [Bacilli bacterium]|nr:hypothetical protein [Bacilli bacterium]